MKQDDRLFRFKIDLFADEKEQEEAFDYWTFEGAAWFLSWVGFDGRLTKLDGHMYKFSLKFGDVETVGIHKTQWGALDDALTKMRKYIHFDNLVHLKEGS